MSYIASAYAQTIKAQDVIVHEGRVYTVSETGVTSDSWIKLVIVQAGFNTTITIEVFPLSGIEKLFIR